MELENLVLVQGAAIGFFSGFIIGVVADRECNPEIELAKLVRENEEVYEGLEQQASSNRLQKRIVEGIVAAGVGITSAYYIGIRNGSIDAIATLAGIQFGEYLGRKIRYAAKLKPEEIKVLSQYIDRLEQAVVEGTKEKFYRAKMEIEHHLRYLFDKKKNVNVYIDAYKKMNEWVKANGCVNIVENWLKNQPTALYTQS